MTGHDVNRLVLRALHDAAPQSTTAAAIARQYELPEPDVRAALNELRVLRLARRRRKRGEQVWSPWI